VVQFKLNHYRVFRDDYARHPDILPKCVNLETIDLTVCAEFSGCGDAKRIPADPVSRLGFSAIGRLLSIIKRLMNRPSFEDEPS
jgi:hypothetical protein